MMKIIFTDHARLRMSQREITENMVKETLESPERTSRGYLNKLLAHKSFKKGSIKIVYVVENNTCIIISVIWEKRR